MILESFRLEGKCALVTGAAQGLGAALAIGFAEAGADVALLDRRSCDETAAAIRSLKRRAFALVSDLADMTPERAIEIVRLCSANLGGLHILVNNAGIIRRSAALDYSEADWDSVSLH